MEMEGGLYISYNDGRGAHLALGQTSPRVCLDGGLPLPALHPVLQLGHGAPAPGGRHIRRGEVRLFKHLTELVPDLRRWWEEGQLTCSDGMQLPNTSSSIRGSFLTVMS